MGAQWRCKGFVMEMSLRGASCAVARHEAKQSPPMWGIAAIQIASAQTTYLLNNPGLWPVCDRATVARSQTGHSIPRKTEKIQKLLGQIFVMLSGVCEASPSRYRRFFVAKTAPQNDKCAGAASMMSLTNTEFSFYGNVSSTERA